MNLTELSKEVYLANKEKGFWPPNSEDRNIGEMLMLAVSELGEAMEALRKENRSSASLEDFETILKTENNIFNENVSTAFQVVLKDSFEDEIGDTIIRLLDMCGGLGIDIQKYIDYKLLYNKTRPFLHGKKY